MGLITRSAGIRASCSSLTVLKRHPDDKVVALAGNPNVGKSTIFNALTGLSQNTGNWAGKTVTNAQGCCDSPEHSYVLVDIPGTYSLMTHSAEEDIARNFLCFGKPDAVVVVCDATCLERNLNLVLQIMEITSRVILCVNLMDEAKRKKIYLNLPLLSRRLGVPVVGVTARKKSTLQPLLQALDQMMAEHDDTHPVKIRYPKYIEHAIRMLEPLIEEKTGGAINSRWLSLRLLDQDSGLLRELSDSLGDGFLQDPELLRGVTLARQHLLRESAHPSQWKDCIAESILSTAEKLCRNVVVMENTSYQRTDMRIDCLLTSRLTGFPLMLLLLAVIFWITISGANYPSALLADGLFFVQDCLSELFLWLHAPAWLHGLLVHGLFRVLAWVISVMLPPMAIFFPLFTLLEDAGYLPRIAYNLDKPFQCCRACGKQALTMCMGFGCNAVGVVGCRIIDSPRERLLAVLTNSFVPCNGRFPTLIALISMFFAGVDGTFFQSVLSTVILTGVIVFGIVVTFLVTRLLSDTILRGTPSSFTLELPPYRRPQVGRIIVHSITERTLFVLGRAAAVAAPAGMLLWIMANVTLDGSSLLAICSDTLEPFARLMGLDGVILLAFILGFPANEIVLPIIVMAYLAQGSLTETGSLLEMRQLLIAHGWTHTTALCTMLFSLLHWPCSTTLLTIRKETGSWKWTILAAILPAILGILCCMIVHMLSILFISL